MKNLRITLIVMLMIGFGSSALAQQVAKKKKDKAPKTEQQVQKGPFADDAVTNNNIPTKKGTKKLTVWDVIPADGFIATGDAELDKKRKMDIQKRWAKENPKEFQQLLELHGFRPKKKE